MSKAHSKLGASGAYRWMKCPGSIRLAEGIADTATFYAAEGTIAHGLGEEALLGGEVRKALGATRMAGEHAIEVTDEMLDAVQVYVDEVEKLRKNGGTERVEARFDLGSLYEGMFGTCDYMHFDWDTRTLTVLDFKYGAGVAVEVNMNPQLLYYALGAMISLSQTAKVVRIGVVQPRAYHVDGPVRYFEIDGVELHDFASDLVRYAKATEAPDAPLVDGDHCKFCRAAAICPRLRERANSVAAKVFGGVKPADLLPADLGALLEKIDLIEDWIKSVREHAYHQAEQGIPVKGWKLVEKRAMRRWRDEQGVRTWLLAQGVERDAIYTEPKLRTVAQIEKELPKDLRPELAQFTVKESSGHTLVSESDKREAVKPSVQQVFKPQPKEIV